MPVIRVAKNATLVTCRERLTGNAVKDSVADLARDPTIVDEDRNSGEVHYSSEPRKFVADIPSQRCLTRSLLKTEGRGGRGSCRAAEVPNALVFSTGQLATEQVLASE